MQKIVFTGSAHVYASPNEHATPDKISSRMKVLGCPTHIPLTDSSNPDKLFEAARKVGAVDANAYMLGDFNKSLGDEGAYPIVFLYLKKL